MSDESGVYVRYGGKIEQKDDISEISDEFIPFGEGILKFRLINLPYKGQERNRTFFSVIHCYSRSHNYIVKKNNYSFILSTPLTISDTSLVMLAWRALL